MKNSKERNDMKRVAIIMMLTVFSFYLVGCDKDDENTVIKREGQPDYSLIAEDNIDLMDTAMAEAKAGINNFDVALEANKEQWEGFAIKKGFAVPGGGSEYIWITEVSFTGNGYRGIIDNEPVDTEEVELGQLVEVSKNEIVDWMFFDEGKLVGGYTIAALIYGTDDQRRYEDMMGIDWSKYEFLNEH